MPEPYLIGPETSRLRHRAMTADDAEVFFRLKGDPVITRYTGEEPIASVDLARDAIANYPDFDVHGYGRWGVELKETGELIGFCGLKYLDEFDAVDIGYRFFPEHWGKGYATEASSACLDFGFETLGLERIIGLVLQDNAASIRVLEKTGMREVGPVVTEGIEALLYERLRH